MRRNDLIEKLKLIVAVEAIILLAAMINEPPQDAKRPPATVAPSIHRASGLKAC